MNELSMNPLTGNTEYNGVLLKAQSQLFRNDAYIVNEVQSQQLMHAFQLLKIGISN